MSSEPVLHLLDFELQFEVHTNAFDKAIGGVLVQEKHPIAYESRKLNDAEQKLLGSKILGLNVLEFQFVILANHNQNVLVLFRLAQSIYFLCKVGIELLQDLLCKSVLLNRLRIRLD